MITTEQKTIEEIWEKFFKTVAPIIMAEIIRQLAASNSHGEAMAKTKHLLKDVFYSGAEVYQTMMLEPTENREQKAVRLEGLYNEITSYTESVRLRLLKQKQTKH